jgi:hypothetical protein
MNYFRFSVNFKVKNQNPNPSKYDAPLVSRYSTANISASSYKSAVKKLLGYTNELTEMHDAQDIVWNAFEVTI